MNPRDKVRIGRTDLMVTRLGLGCGWLGRTSTTEYDPGGEGDARSVATVKKAIALGLNYVDTAPLYGLGKSEMLIGRALSGTKREDFVLSTKVGKLLEPQTHISEGVPPFKAVSDFTGKAVTVSLESSLKRLGLDRVDVVHIHEPAEYYHQAITETYPVLAELRSQGLIKAISVGMNNWEMMLQQFAHDGDFDCFLLAGRYNLLDQTALTEFLPYCEKNHISVIGGAPYASGFLVSDLGPRARYLNQDAPSGFPERAQRIKVVCDRLEVPLRAAAIQFVLAHPAIASAIPGGRSPEEVQDNLLMLEYPIPNELWETLKDDHLIHYDAPTPH